MLKKFDDRMSQAILRELRQNARISWQELGRAVHLSGQAVAERVRQMQDAGVIAGFTLRENVPRHFVRVTMNHTDFAAFEAMVCADERVESVDKTSGDACYMVVYRTGDPVVLEDFLQRILPHGGYLVMGSLRRVK